MTIENRKAGFGARVKDFIQAFDTSPSDYIFDNLDHTREKLRQLEARIARLENPVTELSEVRHEKAI